MTASSGSGRLSHGPLTLGLLLVACALLCAPAWPAGQTLTHEQLERLMKVIDKRGSRTKLPRSVASILELQPGQHTPDIKEAAYEDEQGYRHGFARLNDGSGYFMFRSGTSLGQVVYRVDSNLHLVKAARSLLKNGPLILLPEPEAQRELDDEFQGWSKVLSPSGPAIAPRPYPFKQPESAPLGPVIEPSPYPFKQPEPAPSGPATEPSKQSGAPKP
jgi:hypothetical protein